MCGSIGSLYVYYVYLCLELNLFVVFICFVLIGVDYKIVEEVILINYR